MQLGRHYTLFSWIASNRNSLTNRSVIAIVLHKRKNCLNCIICLPLLKNQLIQKLFVSIMKKLRIKNVFFFNKSLKLMEILLFLRDWKIRLNLKLIYKVLPKTRIALSISSFPDIYWQGKLLVYSEIFFLILAVFQAFLFRNLYELCDSLLIAP